MVIDIIGNSERIESLNPYFKAVFDYIKTHDLAGMPVGRVDIAGEDAFIKIEDARGRSVEEAVYERHDRYSDAAARVGVLRVESQKSVGGGFCFL